MSHARQKIKDKYVWFHICYASAMNQPWGKLNKGM